jgi:hypothetical protein
LGTQEEGEEHSTFASTTGGVMTREVGAITGDLEIATRPKGEGVIEVAVRYAGADEWYTVEGSPIEPDSAGGPSELRELHERIVEHLTTPGSVVEDNEKPVSLEGFSPIADSR